MITESAVIKTGPERMNGIRDPVRTTLTEKIETLEHEFEEMLRGANAAVVEMVEEVRSAVGTTAGAVQGAVHDLVGSTREGVADSAEVMGRVLDVPVYRRRHPWLLVGGALLLGVMLGALVRRGHR